MNRLKTQILFIVFALVTHSVNAQNITIDRAEEIANSFFAQGQTETRSALTQLSKAWDSHLLFLTTRSSSDETPTFYVFTTAKNDAFVIIAGEETDKPIIGYSFDNGISSSDEIPEGLKDYLFEIDSDIRARRNNKISTRATVANTAIGNVIVEIETAKWAQSTPYNKLCPEKNGVKCLTGCIPTAFAIIMRYHKWPESGTGKVYNPITGEAINLSEYKYDWDNMPLAYTSGNYTDEQAEEVATIMRDLGYAYFVEYGTGSTGGSHNSEKLAKYFGYKDVGKTQRWQVGDTEWVRLIKESLNARCPIPYAASNAGNGDAKHIFVLDGYTDNDYYHFNWGWGGSGNGYYLLTDMTPGNYDDYSSKTDSHQAYFNLKPAEPIVTYTISVSSSEGGKATVNNQTTITADEGTIVTLSAVADEGYEFKNWSVGTEIVSYTAETTVTVEADIEYTANFEAIPQPDKVTVELFANSGGKVYIDNDITLTKADVEKGTKVTLHAVADEGYEFDYWAIDNDGFEQPSSLKVDDEIIANEDIVIYAYFRVTTNINNVAADTAQIYTNGHYLHITNFNGAAIVYDNSGKFICKESVTNNTKIELPSGTYIIVLGDRNFKIIIP